MIFLRGHQRIIDKLRPRPLVIGGMRHYWKARWHRRHWPGYSRPQYHKKTKSWQRGWLPGRHRIDGMKAPRRVIDPAVRYWPITRQYNELLPHLRKQGTFKRRLPWDRFNRKRQQTPGA